MKNHGNKNIHQDIASGNHKRKIHNTYKGKSNVWSKGTETEIWALGPLRPQCRFEAGCSIDIWYRQDPPHVDDVPAFQSSWCLVTILVRNHKPRDCPLGKIQVDLGSKNRFYYYLIIVYTLRKICIRLFKKPSSINTKW